MAFKFEVGAKVGFQDRRTEETHYIIIQRMPGEDSVDEPRYKIKAEREGLERVAAESELNSVFEDSQTRKEVAKRRWGVSKK